MKNCRSTSNKNFFVYEENRSKITLENVDRVEAISVIVDGCEINDSSIRCDYLHIAKNIEHFIELKGQDIEHAVLQLENSISKLSTNSKYQEKISYIICTRSPLSSSKIQNLKLLFKKKFNSKLLVKSSPCFEKF